MKQLLLVLVLCFSFVVLQAQSKEVPTNQVFNLDSLVEKKSPESLTKNATKTSNTAIYNKKEYPVYSSKNGHLFIIIQSKTGNWYRRYIQLYKL